MFGRGRFQNGVIIEPTSGHELQDPKDEAALAQFRQEIWLVMPLFLARRSLTFATFPLLGQAFTKRTSSRLLTVGFSERYFISISIFTPLLIGHFASDDSRCFAI